MAGSGALTDWISLGVLASSVPRDVVDEAIAETGRGARRTGGKLPPHVVVYLVMALALFAEVILSFRVSRDCDLRHRVEDTGRVVVKDFLHDVLRDVPVETGRERITNHAEYLSRSGEPWRLLPGW